MDREQRKKREQIDEMNDLFCSIRKYFYAAEQSIIPSNKLILKTNKNE